MFWKEDENAALVDIDGNGQWSAVRVLRAAAPILEHKIGGLPRKGEPHPKHAALHLSAPPALLHDLIDGEWKVTGAKLYYRSAPSTLEHRVEKLEKLVSSGEPPIPSYATPVCNVGTGGTCTVTPGEPDKLIDLLCECRAALEKVWTLEAAEAFRIEWLAVCGKLRKSCSTRERAIVVNDFRDEIIANWESRKILIKEHANQPPKPPTIGEVVAASHASCCKHDATSDAYVKLAAVINEVVASAKAERREADAKIADDMQAFYHSRHDGYAAAAAKTIAIHIRNPK